MIYLKLKKFLIFLILLTYFCLPTVVTADDSQGLGWLYERIDIYKAIEYNKKRIQNSIDLKDDNREYSIESIPDEFIQQGLIKEGDIIKVVLKPKMALPAGNYDSNNLTIRGYNFLSLNRRQKPGYILTGKIIKKVAGSFIVESNTKNNIIVNIPKTNYNFFNVGDTLKCRVFQNTNSYRSAGHLSLYEIHPESFQTAIDERTKNRAIRVGTR